MNPARQIRVLVIDDSAFIRRFLTHIFNQVGGFQVVAAVGDPLKAMNIILSETGVDVITLDVEMPGMDGLEFLHLLMRIRPKPVVMISSWTQENSDIALKALSLGAVDIIAKPLLGFKEGMNKLKAEIISKVQAAAIARVPALATPVRKETGDLAALLAAQPSCGLKETTDKVIAIGASTGGTVALTEIFRTLNPSVPGLILIQHLPAMFTASFAASLNDVGRVRVREAKDGDQIISGQALVVPGGKSLLVKKSGAKYFVRLNPPVKDSIYNPSIDHTLFSVAKEVGKNAMGIILTGMGYDGAEGLKALRAREGYTIAQDEKTSVIYGMPQKAWELGAAVKQAPLEKIAHEIHLWAGLQ